MFNHCKPYRCNIFRFLPAVLAILLGFLYVSADIHTSPTKLTRIALLGDSMTWIGGDSCQNDTGWSHILQESGIAESIDVYARSGATWTNTISTRRNPGFYSEVLHDDNVIFNQAIRLMENADSINEDPDLIILFAGANDAWFAAKRPGIFEKSDSIYNNLTTSQPNLVTTLEGSVMLVCEILQERFPATTLLFVTPLQMSKTTAETIFKVSDIIEKTATSKGWLTLRADKETGITHEQEAKSHKYTYDGVHTNPSGAKKLGDYIVRNLDSSKLHYSTIP